MEARMEAPSRTRSSGLAETSTPCFCRQILRSCRSHVILWYSHFPSRTMISTKPPYRNHTSLVNQVISLIIQNQPFDTQLVRTQQFTIDTVSEVLRSIPRLFFQSTRSIGRQKTFRHRTHLRQRNLQQEYDKLRNNVLVLGPVAYRDPQKIKLGLDKAIEFYYWVETQLGFVHNETTCREMACVLARGNRLKALWEFLQEMSKRGIGKLVTTETITCLIKVLGEEGLVKEALAAFYRMKQFHCKPDVYAYNTIIFALCRVGNFRKARFLLEQMELPGFRCPPDTYTYTILISSYCKYSLQTGCKKAIRRRLWEANHMFRIMVFNGFVPDVVTYNCLIDGCWVTYNSLIRYYSAVNEIDKAVEMLRTMQKLNHGTPSSSSYTPIIHAFCEVGMVVEARDCLVELIDGGSVPREYTYKLLCDVLKSKGEADLLDDALRRRIEDGIHNRYRQVMKVKPIMNQECGMVEV